MPHSEHPIGTVLLAFGCRGQPEDEPLITLKPNAVVRNLVIHYPEQTLADVTPYPWSIRADGQLCRILDVTLTNPYQAIDVGTKWNELHLVRHEGGSSLVLTACPFTGWDHAGKGDPCIRASSRHPGENCAGHLPGFVVNWCVHGVEIGTRPSGFAGHVAVLLDDRWVMKLAGGFAGSASGEHEWTAHHCRFYTCVRHFGGLSSKLTRPLFNPETRESPINGPGVQGQLSALLGRKRASR